jgi:hypothetical protein
MAHRKLNKSKPSVGARHKENKGNLTVKVKSREAKDCHTRNPKPISDNRGD